MKVQNTLAQTIDTFDKHKVALDASCKKLLSHKNILSWILQTCVEEYKSCSLKDIEEQYIIGIPQISSSPLHQDETFDSNECVQGSRNEDISLTEGTVTYDIKFDAISPYNSVRHRRGSSQKCGEHIHMIINVESQTNFYTGYPLPKRGIYYGSRMISAQYGTVFTKSHYEKIRKVYSIWICLNPPKYRRNSINTYSFYENQLVGNVVELKENYDLMTVAMICLNRENDSDCEGLVRLLSVLLSTDRNVKEKKDILQTEFDIKLTEEMQEEANDMCDFSEYVEQKGIAKGEFLLSSLISRLFADGRTEDVLLAVNDAGTRKKLYQEYGITI